MNTTPSNPVLSAAIAATLVPVVPGTTAAPTAPAAPAKKKRPPRHKDSEPVALDVIAARIIEWTATAESVSAAMTQTTKEIAEALAGVAANVAEYFKGYTADLAVYKARRETFDKGITSALEARAKLKGPGIAKASVDRAVRRILAAAKIERPEATTPEALRKKAGRNAGAIHAALYTRDHAALAAAIKKAGGDDSPLVLELREQNPEAFELVERFGARKAKLLELINGLAPDSPTLDRLYAAAGV